MEENMENDVLGFDTDTSIKDDDNTSINVLKESDNSVSNNSAVKQEIPNKIVCTKSLGKTQISEI